MTRTVRGRVHSKLLVTDPLARELIRLKHVSGWAPSEIAGKYNVTQAAMKTAIREAEKRLMSNSLAPEFPRPAPGVAHNVPELVDSVTRALAKEQRRKTKTGRRWPQPSLTPTVLSDDYVPEPEPAKSTKMSRALKKSRTAVKGWATRDKKNGGRKRAGGRKPRVWTDEEIGDALEMYKGGLHFHTIAKNMGTSGTTMKKRILEWLSAGRDREEAAREEERVLSREKVGREVKLFYKNGLWQKDAENTFSTPIDLPPLPPLSVAKKIEARAVKVSTYNAMQRVIRIAAKIQGRYNEKEWGVSSDALEMDMLALQAVLTNYDFVSTDVWHVEVDDDDAVVE